jgi:hypothetical protein
MAIKVDGGGAYEEIRPSWVSSEAWKIEPLQNDPSSMHGEKMGVDMCS